MRILTTYDGYALLFQSDRDRRDLIKNLTNMDDNARVLCMFRTNITKHDCKIRFEAALRVSELLSNEYPEHHEEHKPLKKLKAKRAKKC